MKIRFLHGWTSIPGGVKPTCLAQHGHDVINPALPDKDFGESVRLAQAEFDRHRPDAIVGSSRGGAVALVANRGLPRSALVEIGRDHRLADPAPLRAMLEACERAAI